MRINDIAEIEQYEDVCVWTKLTCSFGNTFQDMKIKGISFKTSQKVFKLLDKEMKRLSKQKRRQLNRKRYEDIHDKINDHGLPSVLKIPKMPTIKPLKTY